MNRFMMMVVAAGMLAAGGAAGAAGTLAEDEAAIAKHIQKLYDPSNEVREAAAKSLREIVAKYGNGTSNIREKDAGEARWMEKVKRAKPGMSRAEVQKLLPPAAGTHERPPWRTGGPTYTVGYQLDAQWIITIYYRDPDKLMEEPTLTRYESSVYVKPPSNYTGVWTTWHFNGQKRQEIQLKDGKYNGTLTDYHDNGRKLVEQHYVNGVCHGPDSGWYPDGKKYYVAEYRNNKKHGQWIHWYPNGQKQSECNYKDDKLDGLDAGWFENGQMSRENHYKDGIRDGVEAGWSEQGVLQYKREYKDGKIVE